MCLAQVLGGGPEDGAALCKCCPRGKNMLSLSGHAVCLLSWGQLQRLEFPNFK